MRTRTSLDSAHADMNGNGTRQFWWTWPVRILDEAERGNALRWKKVGKNNRVVTKPCPSVMATVRRNMTSNAWPRVELVISSSRGFVTWGSSAQFQQVATLRDYVCRFRYGVQQHKCARSA
jgi:hypothetical protein